MSVLLGIIDATFLPVRNKFICFLDYGDAVLHQAEPIVRRDMQGTLMQGPITPAISRLTNLSEM